MFNENNLNATKLASIKSVYPNPMQNNATLQVELLQKAKVDIKIYNIIGRIVHRQNFGELEEGLWYNNLKLNDLPNGIYFCVFFVNNQKTDTIKLMIEK